MAPAAITIQVGTTQKLIAVAYDAAGNVITTAHCRWSSNNLNVARVDSTGTVTAVGDGSGARLSGALQAVALVASPDRAGGASEVSCPVRRASSAAG